ncbi:MAG: hypothetical protein ACR2FO_03930 [Actinomycetota bacterium]
MDKQIGGISWKPLGGMENNVHSVEVASDPAGAIVERVTNAIDAVIDLEAVKRGEMPASPHLAAHKFFGVPTGGISEMALRDRQKLADLIRVTNQESGNQERPTIEIQDGGSGQHPTEFDKTLLSIMASNKKSKRHQMGVYNAGGAAAYAFCSYTIIVSRRAPDLLNGMPDEVGVTVVRYNELDPEKFKSGTYEYCVDSKGDILRMTLEGNALPNLPFGTYVKHISYELSSYSRSAHEPKNSLHHLFNAALPDPAVPFWVEERRVDRFPSLKGAGERRGIYGLIARLMGAGTADYRDDRGPIYLGPENGSVMLRYHILNPEQDPGAFVTPNQGLSFILNGQRQGTKDRYWIKRSTQLNYIWNRLLVFVDCNGLTSTAKRQVFASTRESSKESPLSRKILDRVLEELLQDEELTARDEEARERSLAAATKETSEKVKKQLAHKIAGFVKGTSAGSKGGARQKTTKPVPRRPSVPRKPRDTDDSMMLDIPDTLEIRSDDPVRIYPGKSAPLVIFINAKNGFLPAHSNALSVVLGGELKDKVRLASKGRLVGGIARLTLEADADAPLGFSALTVTLVEPSLGIVLTAGGKAEVAEPPRNQESKKAGGGPDIDIHWIGRAGWDEQTPAWNETTAGTADVYRDAVDGQEHVIVKAEFRLNESFEPYEQVTGAKRFSAEKMKIFSDMFAYPVCWGLFEQTVSEWEREREADENGNPIEIDDDYVRGERSRLARAVLMALAPELAATVEGGE